MKGSSPFFYAMKKAIEDRVFSIEVTYSAKDLNEISQWYINTVMPPIYKNYDLNKTEVAEMIEEEAVTTLMQLGSNQVMTEYLQSHIVVFTPEEAEEFIDGIINEEEE